MICQLDVEGRRMRFGRMWIVLLLGFLCSNLFWFEVNGQDASPAGLLLTEVFYDTPGNDSREEWVEIANVSTAVIDLTDIKIGDEEQSGGREGMLRFPQGTQIAAGEVIVVAQTAASFRALFGFNPNFEIQETDVAVPNMRSFLLWASGELALANDGDELLLLWKTTVIDAINYEESDYFFAPSITAVFRGQSIARVPANCDSDTAADWQPMQTPTPGFVTVEGECAVPINPALLEQLPSIGEIQGEGDVSPLVNQITSFRGVVTGQYADTNSAGITFYTLFVQDLPGFEDGNPATSDGIALFIGRQRPSTQIGDQIRVTGQVTEFFGFTEIDDDALEIRVEESDVSLPTPILWTPTADLESLESMLLFVPNEMRVVGPTFASCGFFVAPAVQPDRHFFQRDNQVSDHHILPILHTNDTDCTGFPQVKTGDTVRGFAGPLIFHFDQFKLVQQVEEMVELTAVPFPTPQPVSVPDNAITIANFNLENHFDAINDTGNNTEPKPTPGEIAQKQQKIAYAITHTLICPTLIGLQEVEHAALLVELAELTADPCGFSYEVTHIESPDARGIDVALLTDSRRVKVAAAVLRQGCTLLDTGIVDETIACAGGERPLFSRPPLQVDLLIDGQPFLIFVNHFKSKREGAAETEPQRLAQARHLHTIITDYLAVDPATNIVVMGDFNDVEQSDMMTQLTASGSTQADGRLTNVLLQIPDEERYSFVFSGMAQLIDAVLLSPALVPLVEAVTILHVNADYPVNLAKDVSPDGLPYRASDHDLPLVVLHPPAADVPSVVLDTAVFPTPIPVLPTPTAVENDLTIAASLRKLPMVWLPLTAAVGLLFAAGWVWWRRLR
jgi:uncharacterized protein